MILNMYVVSYLLLSFLSLLVGGGAMVVGVRVALKWKAGHSSEEQYQLEKKVYLSMTLVMLGFYMRLALAPLWFLMLQSFVPSIPGAMCLAGVHLLQTPHSFISTILKFVLPMAYGYWLVLNALDRKIESQPLMKWKLYALLPLGLLMFFETFSDLRFVFSVKPLFVNCCSSLFDDPSSAIAQKLTYSGWGWAIGFFGVGLSLLALSVFLLRRPRHRAGLLLWLLGPAVLISFALALHTRFSPLFLRAMFHHCIFCIWQKLPDTILATIAICVGCWAAVIFAATRNVYKIAGAEAVADAHAKALLKWTVGALLAGMGILAVRWVVESM
ncbi:MAG TPA: hypothetical protein DCZ95_17820 [Verrucomicrobia bacterium]|nr:MAG: hypothetical protein A2X46_07505 [Lentisphaerae bacterium GWF2_57_35]HBA85945.1 hypothetical protein [Verrucomicrobiota bacterium]